MSAYRVPGTILDPGNLLIEKAQTLPSHNTQVRSETDQKGVVHHRMMKEMDHSRRPPERGDRKLRIEGLRKKFGKGDWDRRCAKYTDTQL